MTTRPLTLEESDAFMRKLHLALGNTAAVTAVLRTIANSGIGLFIVEGE